MNTQQITVAVICGGPSVEHAVSLWSAKNILSACENVGYRAFVIYVQKSGEWVCSGEIDEILKTSSSADIFSDISTVTNKRAISLKPGAGLFIGDEKLLIDVAFPIIHGTMGEDGVLQGALDLIGIPYVGCGVLASAIGMDKSITKIIANHAGIPVAKYLVATANDRPSFIDAQQRLGLPMFVKPASLGSSVGVSKVRNADEFEKAIDLVFSVDDKALIEEAITGREVECSILTAGNELKISSVGEVSTTHDFYSFDAKYLDENSVKITVPAELPQDIIKTIQSHTQILAKACGLRGLSRVDFFYRESDDLVILNEINTLPGFTAMSMYPRLWKASGYSSDQLIKALIEGALLP